MALSANEIASKFNIPLYDAILAIGNVSTEILSDSGGVVMVACGEEIVRQHERFADLMLYNPEESRGDNLGTITKESVIYFLFDQGSLVYVGKSRSLSDRLSAHRANGVIFDSFTYQEYALRELSIAEHYAIAFHKPPLNKSISTRYTILEAIVRRMKKEATDNPALYEAVYRGCREMKFKRKE